MGRPPTSFFGDTHPAIAEEIDPEWSDPAIARSVSAKSRLEVGWRCVRCGFGWDQTIRGRCLPGAIGCRRCASRELGTETVLTGSQIAARRRERKKALAGNNLARRHPALAAELHPTKNGNLDPTLVAPGANYDLWWLCPSCGDEYDSVVCNRTRRNPKPTGCPRCANRAKTAKNTAKRQARVATGDNLAVLHPEIAAELEPSKNHELRAEDLTAGMDVVVTWTCAVCSHDWRATVASRIRGRGCSECWNVRRRAEARARSRALAASGHNLQAEFPDVAAEWHPTKNEDLLPSHVPPRTSRVVWWKDASCGHEWEDTVAHRTDEHARGCPYCRGQRVSEEVNFEAWFPMAAREWHPTLNGALRPRDVRPYSGKPVWWLCPTCDREWPAPPNSRAIGHDCGNCSIAKRSKVEIWVAFELAHFLPEIDPKVNFEVMTSERPFSVDIIVDPERKVAVEYDGMRYHLDLQRDLRRHALLKQAGWTVVYVREEPLEPLGEFSFSVNGQESFRKPHETAARILRLLRDDLGFEIAGLEEYERGNRSVARGDADAFIATKKQRFHQREPA